MKQIDQLIDWNSIEQAITVHSVPNFDAAGRPGYLVLLFKMLLVGIWNGGLSDESVEDMAGLESTRDAISEITAGR